MGPEKLSYCPKESGYPQGQGCGSGYVGPEARFVSDHDAIWGYLRHLGCIFGPLGLSSSSAVRMRPEGMGDLLPARANYHSPEKPSPFQAPSPHSAPLPMPPLTIGGCEIDGHREVDLGPRRGRTAGE